MQTFTTRVTTMGQFPSNTPPDRDLVALVRGGSTEAFGQLVERHHPRVMQVLLQLCGDHDLAEELADRAFLLAFERINQLRDDDEPGKWFVGIAINVWKMRARRRSRLVSLTQIEEQLNFPDVLVSRADDVEQFPERDLLLQTLYRLTDQDRAALILRLKGYSNAEIGDLLNISPSAAQKRTYRAIKRFKRYYEKLNEQPQENDAMNDGDAWSNPDTNPSTS